MKIINPSRDFASRRMVYLPSELIAHILDYVSQSTTRQPDLYSCCLVSQQWYSTSVSFLYEKPIITAGNFDKFADTVCPPSSTAYSRRSARDRGVDNLGQYVHVLDLTPLVHHSTNSRTTRLIGRMRKNLEVFVAPQSSFSTLNLSAISKCLKLTHLDLYYTISAIDFPSIKRSLRNLHHLTTLRLPRTCEITDPANHIPWPSSLTHIRLNRRFTPAALDTLIWPPFIESLTFDSCPHLLSLISSPPSTSTLPALKHPSLKRLRTLKLSPPPDLSIHKILTLLPNLTFLNLPQLNADDASLRAIAEMPSSSFIAHPLRTLELSDTFPNLMIYPERFIATLKGVLRNLRFLGLDAEACMQFGNWDNEMEELEDALMESAATATATAKVRRGGRHDDDDADDDGCETSAVVGVYYIR
ncbi:hypothetical protein AJ80_09979 [Polytolypa hystricis UAMH7299]|uniref:F-box domain-containing protein n=1 Tax=Polytolypa hystricis (strain UAMH7299) TaxID=1447883 RepID=A0A2B7WFG1_POLH7|nr:hypothetical protein AJ80_09979 [Polytolypa hystricis UAMH7299]